MSIKNPPVTPDWMKVSEAAARLQVDRKTVRNRLYSGALPVRVIRLDGVFRLHRKDFDDYLERNARLLAKTS